MGGEQVAIALGRILRAAVGMMHAARRRVSSLDCGFQSRDRQRGVDRATDRVADDATRPGVENHSKVDEPDRDRDIGVSRPKEFRLRPLAEPDVNLLAHPAPIIHPTTDSPSTNGRTRGADVAPAV